MKKSILFTLCIAFLNIQCNSKKNASDEITTTTVTKVTATDATAPSSQYGIVVASKEVDCQGVAKQKCLLVKSLGATKWNLFYNPIAGFNYEEGYEYHLEIKKTEIKNPAEDAPTAKYELVNIISKEKKDSDIRMEVEKPTFDSTWNVITLEGEILKGFISFKKDGSANANVGCNTMAGIRFKADTAKKTIRFDTEKVASTMMACPEDHDMIFQKALAKVTHYEEVSKNKLLLKENATTLLELSR